MLISEKYIINIARDIDPPRKKCGSKDCRRNFICCKEPAPNPIYGEFVKIVW